MGPTRAFIAAALVVVALFGALAANAGEKTYEVYGTLTYPDGRPAPGVHLHWQRANECKDYETVTDSAGGYRISVQGFSGMNFAGFSAQEDDYLLGDSVTIPEETQQPVRKDLKFGYAALVLGEVTDSTNRNPIEGADVSISGGYGGDAKTGSDGMFKVRVLPKSGLMLEVKKDGYVTKMMDFSAQDTEVTGWRVQLKPGGVIRGTVTDQNGKPVAKTCVGITEYTCYFRSVRTDKDGRYEMRNVDPDRTAELRIEDDRITVGESKHIDFPKASMEATCDFVINLAGKELRGITGTVTDESGSPVAGADVHYGRSSCQWNKKATKTDARGSYKLAGISPGKDMILVQADGFAPVFMPVEETGDQRIDVKLGKAHSAQIRVLDPLGRPMAGTSVSVNARTPVLGKLSGDYVTDGNVYRSLYGTATDDKGKAVLDNLPETGVVLSLHKKDYMAPDSTAIRTDATDNVIRMQGTPQVAGTVIDAATGAPIRCFTVKWSGVGIESVAGDESSAFNRSDGKFVVQVGDNRELETRQYIVRVLANGYIGEARTVPAKDAPAADYSNVFKLQRTHSLKGRVVDSAGKGIPDAQVTVVESRGYLDFIIPPQIARTAYQQKYTTGPGGGFTIDPVVERTAVVIIEKQGYPKLVDKQVGLSKPMKLTLPTPATLTIKVASLAGDGVKVCLTPVRDRSSSASSWKELPADGQASYPDMEPGDYRASINSKGRSEMRAFCLKPGQKFTLDLDKKRPVILKGTVTRGGAPVADAEVTVRRGMNEYSSSSTSDAQGKYTIGIEEPGPAEVTHFEMNNGQITGCKSIAAKLKAGENAIDIKLSSGSISGRVLDAKSRPLEGERIEACARWEPPKSRLYNWPVTKGGYWTSSISSSTTSGNGAFTLTDMPDGPVVLAVTTRERRTKWVGAPLVVNGSKPITAVEVKVPEQGTLSVSVVDANTGKPVKAAGISLYTCDHASVVTDYRFAEGTSVPADSYVLWVVPSDGWHMPAHTNVDVKPGKTANVTLKLNPVRQRIVFRAGKGGRFEKLPWPDKDPESLKKETSVPNLRGDVSKGRPWIGFELSDGRTGKPVMAGSSGPEWGGYLPSFDAKREAALPVKPGTYVLDAVLRNTEDYAVSSKANLWHVRRKVVVKAGSDAVIEVK